MGGNHDVPEVGCVDDDAAVDGFRGGNDLLDFGGALAGKDVGGFETADPWFEGEGGDAFIVGDETQRLGEGVADEDGPAGEGGVDLGLKLEITRFVG